MDRTTGPLQFLQVDAAFAALLDESLGRLQQSHRSWNPSRGGSLVPRWLAMMGDWVQRAGVSRFTRLALASTILSSCSLFDEMGVCTAAGCDSGLWVQVNPTQTSRIRIEVFPIALDRQPVYVYDCTGAQCAQIVHFPGLIIERGSVRVTTDRGERVTEIHPVYETFEPNGPDCPPECLQATVVVAAG